MDTISTLDRALVKIDRQHADGMKLEDAENDVISQITGRTEGREVADYENAVNVEDDKGEVEKTPPYSKKRHSLSRLRPGHQGFNM